MMFTAVKSATRVLLGGMLFLWSIQALAVEPRQAMLVVGHQYTFQLPEGVTLVDSPAWSDFDPATAKLTITAPRPAQGQSIELRYRLASADGLPEELSTLRLRVLGAAQCGDSTVHCVDDTPGTTQEFTTIQDAIDTAAPGDGVLVFDGSYAGFRVDRSDTTASLRLEILAAGSQVRITSAHDYQGVAYGAIIVDSSYISLEGFIIENAGHYIAIAARGATPTTPMRGVIIRNNRLGNAQNTNLYLSEIADSLVEGNTLFDAVDQHGIYLANSGSDGTTLRANQSFGNLRNGIHLNGDRFVTGGNGLIDDLILEDNRFHHNGLNGINMDGVQTALIRNNLAYANANRALRAYRIDGQEGPKAYTMINNTLLSDGGWAIKITQDNGGHIFFNNILIVTGSGAGSLCLDHADFVSDNNVVVDRMAFQAPDGDCDVGSLVAWQQGTGQDGASFVDALATLVIDPDADDYHLGQGSTAIDAGRTTLNGAQIAISDIEGNPRLVGPAADLGAYEYQAGLIFAEAFESGDLSAWQ